MAISWSANGHAINVAAMAASGGKLFAATRDNVLWRRDPVPQDVNWTAIGHANDIVAMTGLNDKLYATTSTNNRLWRRDPTGVNINWEDIGHANNVIALTGVNGRLFGITGDHRLWWRDPNGTNVNWLPIAAANDQIVMAGLAGHVFAFAADGRLWWRDPILSDVGWTAMDPPRPGLVAMAGLNGRLFAATKDNTLQRCDPWADIRWTTWPSIAPTPPSRVYPPDGVETWAARTDLPQTTMAQAQGRMLTIVELRGWLADPPRGPNEEPDVEYQLDLDPGWLHAQGIDPAVLMRPGDVLGYQTDDIAVARRRTKLASIGCEVDGWPRNDRRGQQPRPSDWRVVEGYDENTRWAWDPRFDVAGRSLGAGDYVRIVGSLATDQSHDGARAHLTTTYLVLGPEGLRKALQLAGANADTITQRLKEAAGFSAGWIFAGGPPSAADAVTRAGRWNEIHSPDYIERLSQRDEKDPSGNLKNPQTRQLHQILVVAQHGGFGPATEAETFVLPAPPVRPLDHRLRWRDYSTPWTDASTLSGSTVRAFNDRIEVQVTVRGDARPGRFYHLYELWWEKIPPRSGKLSAKVSPAKIAEGIHNISVTAVDSGNGVAVAGRVLLGPDDIGPTNKSIRRVFDIGSQKLTVQCPGYPSVTVTFRVVQEPGRPGPPDVG